MKTILLFAFIFLCFAHLQAQDNYRVTYTGGFKDYKYKCALVFNDSLLISYSYITKKDPHRNKKVLNYRPLMHGNIINKRYDCVFFYRPWAGKDYLVFDTIKYKHWAIGTQIKTIAGYQCQSAYATAGKADTAFIFFTTDLKFPYGPDGIVGAPGLIMEVYDNSRDLYWIAQTVEHTATAINFPGKAKFMTMKDYLENYRY